MEKFDTVIIGAGAAGVGLGTTFRHFGIQNFLIVEKDEVASSFLQWPDEMHLISPSFQGNQFGLRDLNAVTLDTSPGYTLQREHPTGKEYAKYLRQVAAHYELPIKEQTEVQNIQKNQENDKFKIETSEGPIQAKFVIWAGGEYQNSNEDIFQGSKHCKHNSKISSWKKFSKEHNKGDFVIVGGYESGIDAAVQLSKLERESTVLDSNEPWKSDDPDPSVSLSSFTAERLAREQKEKPEKINLVSNTKIEKVEKTENDTYKVYADNKGIWETKNPPILATGFQGSLDQVEDFFEFEEHVQLTEYDESTTTDNFFLAGPSVQHGEAIFCFIYKYRQRFAIIAEEVGKRLGIDVEPAVEKYREENMYLDGPEECCEDICRC